MSGNPRARAALAAAVDGVGGGLHAGLQSGNFAVNDQNGGRVRQDDVAVGGRLAVQQLFQRCGILSRIAAFDILQLAHGQAEFFRKQSFFCHRAVFEGCDMRGAGDGDFIESVMAVDDPCTFGPQPPQRLGHRQQKFSVIDADQLEFRAGRIGKRAEQVEDGAEAERFSDRGDMFHRVMMLRRHQESEIETAQRFLGPCGGQGRIDAQSLQHIGGAGFRA